MAIGHETAARLGAAMLVLMPCHTVSLPAPPAIDNRTDKPPVPSPQTHTGVDVTAALYDLLGRFHHGGIRYNF